MISSLLRRPNLSSIPTGQRFPNRPGMAAGYATAQQALASLPMAGSPAHRGSMFQASLNRERQQTASAAANFAAAAPMPMDANGHYNGAYGNESQAAAARGSFIQRQTGIASANTPAAPVVPLDEQLLQEKVNATKAWTAEHQAGADAKGAWTAAYPGQLQATNAREDKKVTQQGTAIDNTGKYQQGMLKNRADQTAATERMGAAKNQSASDIAAGNNATRKDIAGINAVAKAATALSSSAEHKRMAQYHAEHADLMKAHEDATKSGDEGKIGAAQRALDEHTQKYFPPENPQKQTGATGAPTMTDDEAHQYMRQNNVMGMIPKDSGGINYGQGMPQKPTHINSATGDVLYGNTNGYF